mgnify:CR=1 FL=1
MKECSSINFMGMLAIVFIALKLCGVINWSWCWVLFPVLLPVYILLITGAVYLLMAMVEKFNKKEK